MTTTAGIRVVSWNVNGIRACVRKGFADWLQNGAADIIGIQESRAMLDELPAEVPRQPHWYVDIHSAQRRGYSGVGMLSRRRPDEIHHGVGTERFDAEGRVQFARFGSLWIVNAYFPKGSGTLRDNSRVPYKLDFYRAVFERIEEWRLQGERVLVMGDFNTAHQAIDLARPKDNTETSGFLPIEREEFTRWIDAGWVDTFRHFEKGPGHYSWWSQRFGVRERNIGWRIDYVLASPAVMPFVRGAFLQPHVRGSDHCPVGVDLHPGALDHAAA